MTPQPAQDRQLDKAILIATAIAEAIAEAIQALGEAPSGHLYARVMGHIDIHDYEKTINFLVDKKLVRRDTSHLLTWIGPRPAAAEVN